MSFSNLNLFAGSGSLSYGLAQSGLVGNTLAIEYDAEALTTLRANRGNFWMLGKDKDLITVNGDLSINPDKFIYSDRVDMLTASLPTKHYTARSVSTRQQSIVDTHDISATLSHVIQCRPKIVYIEALPGLRECNAGNPFRWLLSSLRMQGYTVISQVINMVHYGVPQHRDRLIILAWESTKIPPLGLHGGFLPLEPISPHKTLRQALEDVPESIGSKLAPQTAEKFKAVKPGTTYRGQNSSAIYHRLAWDAPTPAMGTTQDAYCHPDQLRRLTVREVARVQTIPDHYVITGNLLQQYRLIGAATPPEFTRQLGLAILKRLTSNLT
jgi:DNA (cytosine-5)-methyltransferase 1